MSVDATRYPGLLDEFAAPWAPDRLRVRFELEPPRDDLVTNVRMFAFVGDDVVQLVTRDFGRGAAPGGTLEPGEAVWDGLQRELREEIGGYALSYEVFGRFVLTSSGTQPHRPYFPHPMTHWIVGYGDVVIDGEPTQPEDGETILAVEVLSIERAAAALFEDGKPWDAQLVRLAADLRASTRG